MKKIMLRALFLVMVSGSLISAMAEKSAFAEKIAALRTLIPLLVDTDPKLNNFLNQATKGSMPPDLNDLGQRKSPAAPQKATAAQQQPTPLSSQNNWKE